MKKAVIFFVLIMMWGVSPGQNPNTRINTSGGIYGNTSGKPRGNTNTRVTSRGVENPWVFSGNVGFDFGENYFHISLEPQIGYFLTSYFIVGAGLSYNLYNNTNTDYVRHTLGANVYACAYLLQYITFHLQPEVYTSWRSPDGSLKGSTPAASILAGVGLTYPVSPGSYISAMLYYDLLRNPNSLYGDKLFYSVGYGFRF